MSFVSVTQIIVVKQNLKVFKGGIFIYLFIYCLFLQLTALSTLWVSYCRCRSLLSASSQSGPVSTWPLLVSPTLAAFQNAWFQCLKISTWLLSRVQWWSQHFLECVGAGSYFSLIPFSTNVRASEKWVMMQLSTSLLLFHSHNSLQAYFSLYTVCH